MLRMELVMKKFYDYFESVFFDADEKFIEEEGRRIFLMFLRPIINGAGNYYIEAQTRDKSRTDVIVDYRGRQFIIELKLWRGKNIIMTDRLSWRDIWNNITRTEDTC